MQGGRVLRLTLSSDVVSLIKCRKYPCDGHCRISRMHAASRSCMHTASRSTTKRITPSSAFAYCSAPSPVHSAKIHLLRLASDPPPSSPALADAHWMVSGRRILLPCTISVYHLPSPSNFHPPPPRSCASVVTDALVLAPRRILLELRHAQKHASPLAGSVGEVKAKAQCCQPLRGHRLWRTTRLEFIEFGLPVARGFLHLVHLVWCVMGCR